MIAAHLASRAAPAVRPTMLVDPRPHYVEGCAVTLWDFVDGRAVADGDDARAATSALKVLHREFKCLTIELPAFTASIDSCEPILSKSSAAPHLRRTDRLFLHRLYARFRQELGSRSLRCRPIHGDAHFGNVLVKRDGAVWLDLEAVCSGPSNGTSRLYPPPTGQNSTAWIRTLPN